MKKVIAILVITIFGCLACKKNIPVETGTIGGLPALTLYGSSNGASDYLFLSTAQKKVSYNGNIFTYVNGPASSIFLIYSGVTAAKAVLDTTVPKTTITIDTTFGFTFGSTVYTAK